MIKVKFPSGTTGSEILHYMGVDDEQSMGQRPELAQRLAAKCFAGKEVVLEPDELEQLISEVENAHSIKDDHVGTEDWSALQQYNLGKYLAKLKSLRSTHPTP